MWRTLWGRKLFRHRLLKPREEREPVSSRCRYRSLIALVAASFLVLPSVGRANDLSQLRFVDAAGDANYLNGQYLLSWPDDGPDTRPASVEGADILAAWYETEYDVVKDLHAEGRVRSVRHVPTALLFRIRTAAAAAPTFGPTLRYEFYAHVGCLIGFRMIVHGPLSGAGGAEPAQGATLHTYEECPVAQPAAQDEGFDLSFDGSLATLRFPFSALAKGLLEPGTEISSGQWGGEVFSVHRAGPCLCPGLYIDVTSIPSGSFVIGSDVPADVDCGLTPDDPECASP